MTGALTTDSKPRDKKFSVEMLEIVRIMSSQKYKVIILYLIAENEHPKPEVMQLLREMALRGYLVFIGEPSDSGGIEILEENLILVHQGFSLISVIKSLSAIILSTQNIHPDWAEVLHHKLLWLHIDMDTPINISEDIFNQADLITYFPTTSVAEKFTSTGKGLSLKLGQENQVNVDLIEGKIKSLPLGWRPYANLNLLGKVAVMTATFLDFSGEYFYNGGAERYLLDLAEICEELNSQLVIFQYGDYPWMRRFKNIDIVSLSRRGVRAEGWILKCARDFNRVFYEQVQGRTALNIYSAFFEAWPLAAAPNIGISHGVSWDNPYNDYENAVEYWLSLLKNKIDKTPVNKITNSRTVEIKLPSNPVDYSKLGELITSLLSNGDLVYVRSGEMPDPELSFARIQWLSPETPLFAPCDLTIEW